MITNKPSVKINIMSILIIGLLLFLSGVNNFVSAQSQTYTTSGTYSFVAPSGVTSVTVECWGAGGAGGGQNTNQDGGGGGGGGAYSKKINITVIPGNSYNVYVGAAGIGVASSKGGDGGDTYFISNTTVLAKGGIGGSPSTGTPPAGGLGGAATSGIGDTKYSGGQGEKGLDNGTGLGGYGGSSAGNASNGYSGPQTYSINTYPTASTPVGAGNGGDGGAANANGSAPASGNGGGGGGSGEGSAKVGGSGADGKVVIRWGLNVSTTNLNFGYVASGSTSSVQSVTINGSNLSGAPGNISVTAPANFEVSLSSGSGFGSSVNVPYSSSTLSNTLIYIRFKPTSSINYFNSINISGGGFSTNFTVSGLSINYCSSSGNTSFQTSVTLVSFGSINNSSAKPSGYSNYLSQSTTVLPGGSYSLGVKVNTDGNYTAYAYAWIDWNQNGSFADAGEAYNLGSVINTANGYTSLCPLNITVPVGATLGTTVMRVSNQYNAAPTSCLTNFDGEVEDYTILVQSAASITTGTISPTSLCIASNFSVPFTISGSFTSGNVFTAQLSDASGNFGSPLAIGSLTQTTSGTITASIPSGTAEGTGYRIRVVSSQPNITGSNNGTNLSITSVLSSVVVTPNSNQSLCSSGNGNLLTVSETGGGTILGRQWGKRASSAGTITPISGATASAYTPTGADLGLGTWYIVCTSTPTCGSIIVSNEIALTVNDVNVNYAGIIVNSTCPTSSDGAITINNALDPAISFKNATSDYIDIGTPLLSNLSAFTVEGWIKFNKADITGSRVGSLFGQNDVVEFGFYDANTIQCYTAGGGTVTSNMSNYPNDNAWHHIAAVGSGTSLIIYVDGMSIVSGGIATTNYGSVTTYSAKIGGGVWDATGGSFNGEIQKVGFWNIALTPTQLSALASGYSVYTGSESGLIAGYNTLEGSGTTISSLPAGKNGAFVNTPAWTNLINFSWSKTGDGSFSRTTKNISGLTSGEYNLSASIGGCANIKNFTVNSTNAATLINSQSTATQTACLGGSFSAISVSATGGGTLTYQWYKNASASNSGGTSLGSLNGAQTNTYIPQATTVGTLYYYCVVTGTCGSVTSLVSGSFVVRPTPTASIAGSSTVCQNATSPSITFTNPQSDPITITYNINGANQTTINVGANTSSTVSASTLVAGSFTYNLISVVYQSAPTCSNIISGSATVIVTPTVGTPTAITISAGTEPSCQLTNGTTTTTYATTATNNTGFNWSLSNGAAGSIGATTGIMTWASGFSGSVDILVTANGCNGPSTQVSRNVTITPTVGTPTAITISAGTEPTCQLTNGTTTTTYATTATNNTGFNWSLSNGAAGSIGATTGIMTWANGFSGSVNILVTANGCNGPSSQVSRNVTITPTVGTPTAITISAGTEPSCQLTNSTTRTTYVTTATNNTGFNWSLSNEAAGSIDATGYMKWTNGFSGSVNILVTANGCNGPSAQVSRTVTITPTVGTPTAITVSAGTEPTCQLINGTTTTTYATTATNNTGFNWSLSNGAAGSIGATTGIMTWTNGFSGSVNILVTANGCNGPSSQVSRNVTITPTVGIPVFALGTTSSRCRAAGSVIYTATASNSTSMVYSLDAASSLAGNSIDPSTGTVTYVFAWKGPSTITATATGCNGPSISTHTVTIISDLIWTGAISTNWNIAGNWSCNFIPDLTTNVQIPNVSNKPILSSGSIGTAQNIVIDNGSSLTVTGNTLQISGTIANNGTFTASAGTIEMKGSVAQAIGANVFSGNTIKDLKINNPAGVSLLGTLNISGVVTAATGNLSSSGYLTLLSTVTQTALIDGTGAGSVNGDVTMQRYLPSGFGYKYFSSPFQSATVNEFADDMDLSASFPTFYSYDEDNHRDSLGIAIYKTGWHIYVATSNPLIPMAGYSGNFGNSSAAKTVSMKGVVNNNILSTLTLYNHNRIYTKGFNLIGNPYPSPIDWNASNGWTKTNIDNALYFFDAGTTDQYIGTYSSYINGVPSNGTTSNIIPSMQGFFVHVTDGSYPVTATLGMDNRVRVNNLTPYFHKSLNSESKPIIRIRAAFQNEKISDATVVYFNDFSEAGFEKDFDALKLMNDDYRVPNIYSLTSKANRLSISAIPYPIDSITKTPLGLKTDQSGWITITASEIENMPSNLRVYLTDNETGLVQDLQINPVYRFHTENGLFENRFALVYSQKELNSLTKATDSFYTNITNGKLSIFVKLEVGVLSRLVISNLLGQIILQKNNINSGLNEIDQFLPAGVYVVALYSEKGIQSKKIFIPK